MLNAPQVKIIHADTLTWLNDTSQAFDIIFLDPPYSNNLLPAVLQILSQRALLNTGARIYIELSAEQPVPTLPAGWELLRSQKSRTGEVLFGCAPQIFSDRASIIVDLREKSFYSS